MKAKMRKERKQALIALFLIFLMGGSTFAYSFINSLRTQREEVSLPKEKILNHELTEEQEERFLMSAGTIIKLYYTISCTDCMKIRNVLESIVQNSGRVYLIEIEGNENKMQIYNANFDETLSLSEMKDETLLKRKVCEAFINLERVFVNYRSPEWCVAYTIGV